MKIMLLGLALMTTSAFACERPEAQFIGKAKNVTADCTYQVEFTQFSSSMVCPLDDIEASTAVLKDSSCTIKNGDLVSGYLAKINDEIVLD